MGPVNEGTQSVGTNASDLVPVPPAASVAAVATAAVAAGPAVELARVAEPGLLFAPVHWYIMRHDEMGWDGMME